MKDLESMGNVYTKFDMLFDMLWQRYPDALM